MQQRELGEFLRSRRERTDPTSVGYPASDRRRTPGLRREELAASAGVAVSWLTKLEQGRAQSVSADVLDSLAGALALDHAERTHLFALAGLRVEAGAADAPVTAAMRRLLDDLDPDPAYVLDAGWDIVAWNRAEGALFAGLEEAAAGGPPNLLELTFTDPALASIMADHDAELARLVAQFRLHRTDWPSPQLDELVDRLQTRSPRFAALWSARDVAPFESTRRVFDHPLAGRLELDHHRLAVLDRPGAQLVVYTSAPGTDSVGALARATVLSG
jgi:transcriptional regulator with XRE-family HTH domain